MDDWVDGWIKGFIEAQGSLAVNIGLGESKNQKWFIFKPYITIANMDKGQVEFIREYFGFNSKITAKKIKKAYENPIYSLNLQREDDIKLFIEKFKNHRFKSDVKQFKYDTFVKCFNKIVEIGYIHKEWKEQFNEIIEMKLVINKKRGNINKNRMSKTDWFNKINEHLG